MTCFPLRRRLVKRLYIPLPDKPARADILGRLLTQINHCLTDDDVTRVADLTHGTRLTVKLGIPCREGLIWRQLLKWRLDHNHLILLVLKNNIPVSGE